MFIFDDGPNPEITPKLLDVLRSPAIFFVIGKRAKQYPEIVREIVRRGYPLGNHTYSHVPLVGLPVEKVREEIEHWDETIDKIIPGYRTYYFRAPGNAWNAELQEIFDLHLFDTPTTAGDWDWDYENGDPGQKVAEICEAKKATPIIALHDGVDTEPPNWRRGLPALLAVQAIEKGRSSAP